MKKKAPLLLLLGLMLTGCHSALVTALYVINGPDVPPKYDILLKGKGDNKRVAVVPRVVYANAYELQNAPREIARSVNALLEVNVKNKKLRVVEQPKIEAWLDQCNNDFDSFVEVGRNRSIKADIVIGFEILKFQIRDPHNAALLQGRCEVKVVAVDCATGTTLASEMLSIVDPPNMPLDNNPRKEFQFRTQFIDVVAQQIAALFHHYDPHKLRRIDADNLEMTRIH